MTRKIIAPTACTIASLHVEEGQSAPKGTVLIATEVMKMVHEHKAVEPCRVTALHVASGDFVEEGALLMEVEPVADSPATPDRQDGAKGDHPALAELHQRRQAFSDQGRKARVEKHRASGSRTARENITHLLDDGSFSEFGAHVIAAQRGRHGESDLIERSAGDGVIVGTGTVDGAPVAVLAGDYTVMAATQGYFHHKKVDRIAEIALRRNLPLVIWPEGGGGRPNDTDTENLVIAGLSVSSFRELARLANRVPIIAVVHGYCFAGSAAFGAVADIIIMTESASLGMGGPAMIEGGGLGCVAPQDVGPASVMAANGVADIIAADETAATGIARDLVGLFNSTQKDGTAPDPDALTGLMPIDGKTVFDIRAVVEGIVDTASWIELGAEHAQPLVAGLARIEGRPLAVLANDSGHLGGAIDGAAAAKAKRLFELAQKHHLPILSLVDTPGFMVGPQAEATGQAREIGAMFRAGAALTVPLVAVVLRRAYGLGAMAMAGGALQAADLCIGWPTGEIGAMGIEGAVRLGARDHLNTFRSGDERENEVTRLVAEQKRRGRALNAAAFFEFDDVIAPIETRDRIIAALANAPAN